MSARPRRPPVPCANPQRFGDSALGALGHARLPDHHSPRGPLAVNSGRGAGEAPVDEPRRRRREGRIASRFHQPSWPGQARPRRGKWRRRGDAQIRVRRQAISIAWAPFRSRPRPPRARRAPAAGERRRGAEARATSQFHSTVMAGLVPAIHVVPPPGAPQSWAEAEPRGWPGQARP